MSRKTRAFRPTSLDSLESRLVLSRAGVASAAFAQFAPSGAQVLNKKLLGDIPKQIDRAFKSFASDYHKAYLNISKATGGVGNLDALYSYAEQRRGLLERQLVASMSRLSGATDDLAFTVSDRLDTMLGDMESFDTFRSARRAGPAIESARIDTRAAHRDFILAGVDSGDYVLQGARVNALGRIVNN